MFPTKGRALTDKDYFSQENEMKRPENESLDSVSPIFLFFHSFGRKDTSSPVIVHSFLVSDFKRKMIAKKRV
jgi:hypothetical protein